MFYTSFYTFVPCLEFLHSPFACSVHRYLPGVVGNSPVLSPALWKVSVILQEPPHDIYLPTAFTSTFLPCAQTWSYRKDTVLEGVSFLATATYTVLIHELPTYVHASVYPVTTILWRWEECHAVHLPSVGYYLYSARYLWVVF